MFVWEQDRRGGLNEIGSNKKYIFQHSERDQVVLSRDNTRFRYKAHEMRGRGLSMPHKAR